MNPQAHYIWCSYGYQVETSLSSCGRRCANLGIGSKRKGRPEKLVKMGKFSFYVMVDRKIFTYLKNKKQVILIVNKKFKIFDF